MEAVLAALERYKTHGLGRFRSRIHVQTFQEEVIMTVEAVRASWRFKRSIAGTEDEHQDDETP